MISRKKILSRSQSDLDYNIYEEDVWYNKDKLYQDHITEILRKWEQIDDEIWGKIICMERNRRIAKAYSRVPVLSITGAEDGFDGYKIGMNGFDNPMRDALTKTVKRHIGKGVRLKMDDLGNIIIKRMSNCDVFIRGWDKESNSLSDEIIELSGELEYDKSVKLFDMKKFQAGIARELRSAYPDRRRLENQCICAIAFVKDAPDVLDLCSWILLINIVALDLLKSRFPTMSAAYSRVGLDFPLASAGSGGGNVKGGAPKFVSIFEQQQTRIGSSDEDPYSLPSIPSSGSAPGGPRGGGDATVQRGAGGDKSNSKTMSSDQKPPELPPRDFGKIKKSKSKNLPQAIKSLVKMDSKANNSSQQSNGSNNLKQSQTLSTQAKKEADKKKEIEYEDPYYCGLQARVPNFGGQQNPRKSANNTSNPGHQSSSQQIYGQHQDMRKAQSSGFLNSLFNPTSSGLMQRGSQYSSYYDSSFESDAYGISSGSGYDIYAPLNSGPLYGRVRAQLHPSQSHQQMNHNRQGGNSKHRQDVGGHGGNDSSGFGGSSGGGSAGGYGRYGGVAGNQQLVHSSQYRKFGEPFSYTARYATEWD